jgi:hypothetical protein
MITLNCLDLFLSLTFHQSFENFELIKHTKLSFHGVLKNVFLEKSTRYDGVCHMYSHHKNSSHEI